MTDEPAKEFGKRKPQPTHEEKAPARKRSNQVALLMMGTVALGGGAYALMPSEHCDPSRPAVSASVPGQPNECQRRSWWSSSSGSHFYGGGGGGSSGSDGGSSARSNFASTGSSSSSGVGSASSSSSSVSRGGFGSFAAHFSGGG